MRLRLLVSAALVAASVFVGAAPAQASACPPETEGPCCNEGPVNALYKKLTGEDLIHCPW
jgi:hypothetical protein